MSRAKFESELSDHQSYLANRFHLGRLRGLGGKPKKASHKSLVQFHTEPHLRNGVDQLIILTHQQTTKAAEVRDRFTQSDWNERR